MEPHDLPGTLRRLEPGGWLDAARRFASSLRTAGHEPGRLVVVGTPGHEPWHLTAHLAHTAHWRDAPGLQPVLARWHVPAGAPAHLAVGVDAVQSAGRGTTVLVATPDGDHDGLLERLADARRGGATLFALHPGDGDLDAVAHESLSTRPAGLELASHAVSAASLPAHRRWTRWRP